MLALFIMFMIDLMRAREGCTKGRMWPAGRSLLRSDIHTGDTYNIQINERHYQHDDRSDCKCSIISGYMANQLPHS